MLHGTTAPDAGPLWADTMTELLPGWADRQMPFSQIHGHNSLTTWRGDDTTVPPAGTEALVTIDADAKHESVDLGGGRLIGIDPDHRDTAAAEALCIKVIACPMIGDEQQTEIAALPLLAAAHAG